MKSLRKQDNTFLSSFGMKESFKRKYLIISYIIKFFSMKRNLESPIFAEFRVMAASDLG